MKMTSKAVTLPNHRAMKTYKGLEG